MEFVTALKSCGLEDSGDLAAWKVGALAYSPIDGRAPEIKADPYFAEIIKRWEKGGLPKPPGFAKFPSGIKNYSEWAEEPSEEFKEEVRKLKRVKKDWLERWRDVSRNVAVANADPVVEVQWVVANRLTEPEELDPDTVPSKAAIAKLALAQESSANFAEFLRNYDCKLIPERKQLEYQSKFRDDGRSLEQLAEFERALDAEGSAA